MSSQATAGPANKRYDRQLRIWGPHGQARLERTRVCVLGAGPTATETLKSLVLGGICSFTIVDSGLVSPEDLRNNFFLSTDSVGKGRAEAATMLIRDLNENVQGAYTDAKLEELIEKRPEFFERFTLVIATQVSGPELCIVESRPDNVPNDLRLATPWPELLDFAASIDLATCDDITHEHTPYAVILLKAMRSWLDSHGGPPSGASERREFKNSIQAMQRSVDGTVLEEPNFQEVQAILDDPAVNVKESSSRFWIMAAALKRFVANEGEGCLPLEGSIPDMWATTELYLRLQRVYRSRAEQHCNAVLDHARDIQQTLRQDAQADDLSAEVRQFCKHAQHLRLARFQTLRNEFAGPSCANMLKQHLAQESADEASLYVLLRAADQYFETHGRLPGETPSPSDPTWEHDIQQLRLIVAKLVGDMGLPMSSISEEMMVDVCRCAGAELQCTAAVMGGIAAQESIKVMMQQFVPISGTMVYNGARSSTTVFHS